ncbi:hemolysin III family protein [Aquicoccus sp. G2-2]|uniref:PAQR family membrane homeostasis protein TrhA n=1 Tax=Aquicoccus sp. G2-2 TaxID=3092120 RepID=UPI002ADFA920|nr:hemolysin III family protein [Aquicoccus sp. G2-2]MEA1114448.1 hemolysin III family protein [Aquicoccus sp. G2-2]
MPNREPAYPTFARSERVADAVLHMLGVAGALTGTIWILVWTFGRVSGGQTAALSVYGATLIAGFIASSIYHFTPWENLRPLFRRMDHAAIYLKIAGTYTPLVVMVGNLSSYLILAAVWAMAAFGVVVKFCFWKNPNRNGIALYLGMGWLSVLLIGSLFTILPGSALALIAAGGLLYTFGVAFHVWDTLKFSNAIWHGFVLTASACFFAAIALGVGSGAI